MFQQPDKISPELEERVSGFSQKTIVILKALRKFKDTLPSALERKRGEPLGAHRRTGAANREFRKGVLQVKEEQIQHLWVNVTLDSDTAHPNLILSEDRKYVRWGDTWQDLPKNHERFDTVVCVLGCERFTSGL
ncbi:erythroid membrane-associated protein-like [Mauremys mutica]|uniref:erythroid membrane-associated protein-like n=1 Tax=Mauremys mutica TaxID=74926 RepID=UPI001D16DD76|nr:erythroid membrane-associated protein-like [Mauremys mutica]